jgi:hypothetical protein
MRLRLFLTFAIGFAAASAAPDSTEVVRLSVKAIQSDWAQAPGYSFEEREEESKHNARATVKTYQVLMLDASPYRRVVALNDRPLLAGEQAEEERKLRAEIHKREHESSRERAKRIAKYEKERRQDQAMLMAMVDAFDFQFAGEENVNGHDCWILDAQPRRNYQPKDRETKVLAGMRGRLWIDKTQHQWVRVKADVVKPVSFFGFVAKVGPGTTILLEQEPVAENLWLPKHFSMHVKASAFGFLDESSSDNETYCDYKPLPKTSAGLTTEREP